MCLAGMLLSEQSVQCISVRLHRFWGHKFLLPPICGFQDLPHGALASQRDVDHMSLDTPHLPLLAIVMGFRKRVWMGPRKEPLFLTRPGIDFPLHGHSSVAITSASPDFLKAQLKAAEEECLCLPAAPARSSDCQLASNSHMREAGGELRPRDACIRDSSTVHFVGASAPEVFMRSDSVH